VAASRAKSLGAGLGLRGGAPGSVTAFTARAAVAVALAAGPTVAVASASRPTITVALAAGPTIAISPAATLRRERLGDQRFVLAGADACE